MGPTKGNEGSFRGGLLEETASEIIHGKLHSLVFVGAHGIRPSGHDLRAPHGLVQEEVQLCVCSRVRTRVRQMEQVPTELSEGIGSI